MKKALIFCLLAVAMSIAQKQRVAVLPTIAEPEAQLSVRQLNMLTDKLRSIATDSLPKEGFIVLKEDFLREQLGDSDYFLACKDGTCIGTLMEKVQANFGTRCEVFSINNKLRLKFELYGTLIGDTEAGMIHIIPGEEVKDFEAMLALLDKKVPAAFKKILPSTPMVFAPIVQSDISGAQSSSSGTVNSGAFTDARDGKKYKTAKIGNQTWMAENLNYATSGVCYDNKPENCAKYGRLYNWSSAKQACPKGWHLPSDADWTKLTDYVSGAVGSKLKAHSGWNSGGNGADNFGFSALPGGNGASRGSFNLVGEYGYWWSATEVHNANSQAWYRDMSHNYTIIGGGGNHKSMLFSVRCLKD